MFPPTSVSQARRWKPLAAFLLAGSLLFSFASTNASYSAVPLTSQTNRSLRLTIQALEYRGTSWTYKVVWNRTAKTRVENGQTVPRTGSVRFSLYPDRNAVLTSSTDTTSVGPEGELTIDLRPCTRYRVEFYASPNYRGTLLLRKFFTTLNADGSPSCSTTGTGSGSGTSSTATGNYPPVDPNYDNVVVMNKMPGYDFSPENLSLFLNKYIKTDYAKYLVGSQCSRYLQESGSAMRVSAFFAAYPQCREVFVVQTDILTEKTTACLNDIKSYVGAANTSSRTYRPTFAMRSSTDSSLNELCEPKAVLWNSTDSNASIRAAQDACMSIAQRQGRALGFDITCNRSVADQYGYMTACHVPKLGPMSAYTLVGSIRYTQGWKSLEQAVRAVEAQEALGASSVVYDRVNDVFIPTHQADSRTRYGNPTQSTACTGLIKVNPVLQEGLRDQVSNNGYLTFSWTAPREFATVSVYLTSWEMVSGTGQEIASVIAENTPNTGSLRIKYPNLPGNQGTKFYHLRIVGPGGVYGQRENALALGNMNQDICSDDEIYVARLGNTGVGGCVKKLPQPTVAFVYDRGTGSVTQANISGRMFYRPGEAKTIGFSVGRLATTKVNLDLVPIRCEPFPSNVNPATLSEGRMYYCWNPRFDFAAKQRLFSNLTQGACDQYESYSPYWEQAYGGGGGAVYCGKQDWTVPSGLSGLYMIMASDADPGNPYAQYPANAPAFRKVDLASGMVLEIGQQPQACSGALAGPEAPGSSMICRVSNPPSPNTSNSGAPTITTTDMPAARVGQGWGTQLLTDQTGTMTWSVSAKPAWLNVSNAEGSRGWVSGVPTAAGSFPLTVTATNGAGQTSAPRTFTITVSP